MKRGAGRVRRVSCPLARLTNRGLGVSDIGPRQTHEEHDLIAQPTRRIGVALGIGLAVHACVVALAQMAWALPAAAQLSDAVDRVSLDEAVDIALGRSPQMIQQEQAIENASLAQRSAWAAFLPNINANTGGSLRSSNVLDPNTGRIVGGSSDSYSAGVSANIPIFLGGSRFLELGSSKADMRAAVARREDQRHSVILQTKNLFFAALRQEELLAVRQRQVERTEENLSRVVALLRAGRGTVSDSLRARLDLVNAQQAVLVTETDLRSARMALGRQVGRNGPVMPIAPPNLDPGPLPLTEEEILRVAEEASPSVMAAAEASAAAASAVTVNKTAYLPNVSLSSGYSWNNQERSFNGGRTSWNMSLSMSYPIFNRFQRESNLDRSQMSLRVSRLQEEDARLAARQEADAAIHDLRTAEVAIDIARQAVSLAEEDLRVVLLRHDVGAVTLLDVIISQAAADQAAADLVGARYDYILARATLEALLGREL